MNETESSKFLDKNGFNQSFLDDDRFKGEPGQILCNRLREELGADPQHNISLDSALEFINFYGIKGVIDMESDAWMRLIAQEALRAIDKAMLEGYSVKMVKGI
jgi:hypothetical protein